jgi:hypothetical protein
MRVFLQSDEVKYLGLYLDRILTWHKHIFTKRKQLGFTLTKSIGCSDVSPNSPPPTNYYSIKPCSNPSGPMVYNSRALLQPPILKFWNDSNLRSCAWLWTHPGTSLIHSSEGTSAALQSKTKSVVTALTIVIDFAPIPIILQSTFFDCLTPDAFAGFCLMIRGLKSIDMELRYWALLFMPLVILRHLLNVSVQLANKRGFKQQQQIY